MSEDKRKTLNQLLREGASEGLTQLRKEELAAMLMILKGWTKDEALTQIEKAYSGIQP